MLSEKQQLKKLMKFLEMYPGGFFIKDHEGRYAYSSNICEHVNPDEECGLIGKNELEVQEDPALGREYYEQDRKLLKEGGSIKCYSKIAEEYYEINKSAVQDDNGEIIGIIGTVIDVTKEFLVRKKVEKQMVTDFNTGLYNSHFLKNWKEKEEPVYPFTVITGDCNFLKHVNDHFGHEYGDLLLKNAGEVLLENLPEKCYPIRVGGDEFLILCNDTTEEEAKAYMEALTEKAKERSVCGIPLSIAYGSCTIQKKGDCTLEECRNLADAHMYTSKRRMKEEYFRGVGKNDPVYNEAMLRKLLNQLPVVIFFKDTDCRYQYINVYKESHLKDKEEMHLGIGCTDLELQQDKVLGREYYEDDLRILKTGKGSIQHSTMMENGEPHFYQITKSAVYNEDGTIAGIAGIVMDITSTRIDFMEKL